MPTFTSKVMKLFVRFYRGRSMQSIHNLVSYDIPKFDSNLFKHSHCIRKAYQITFE